MATNVDVYSPCPGGAPRKIKFCQCGKDMLGDLDKIMGSLQGGQRAGALSHINQAIEAKGNRACLLALKGMLQLQLHEGEGLAETAETFLQAHPENPVALAYSAIISASKGEPDAAIEQLQRAFQESPSGIHEAVFSALEVVSELLVQIGDVMAARAHLSLLAQLTPDREHNHAFETLMQLNASPSVPLLMKQRMAFLPPPENVLWRDACQAALDQYHKGAWAEALERFEVLAEELPRERVIWKNIAILRGFLAQPLAAADAWRTYSGLDGVDPEEAIEAAALAQMLGEAEQPTVDEVVQSYPISDTDRAMERLLSDKRVDAMPGDLSKLATEESPPPKAAFWLLDRPVPRTVEGLTAADVPNVLGEMYVFGRQTDRQARLELVTVKTADFETKAKLVRDLLGEFGGDMEREEVTGQVPATTAALVWRWRLPDGVTLDQRRNLIEDKRRDIHLNVWPNTSLPMLDGKRPLDVASDPAYRVRLLAAILVLDLAGEQSQSTFDYNELRAKLGLPIRSDIALDGKTVADISLVRLHLLPPEQLSDEDLANAYIRAAMHRASRAIRRLAPDVVKRPNLKSKVDFGEVYYTLSQVAHNLDEAVEFNKHAQEAAIAGGKSPARWLLQELDLRMMRGEPQECDRVVRRLETRHGREPGVMEALYAWLVRIGVITPDGRPAAGLAARRPEAAAVTAGAEPAGPAAGLWTPDRPSPPPTDQGKPGLWLPGMD